uniref:Uncharacterized protein n=1 Tax=Romanomermis culicivorax TaxID=13658 RepID=A0A915HU03_ROMCU
MNLFSGSRSTNSWIFPSPKSTGGCFCSRVKPWYSAKIGSKRSMKAKNEGQSDLKLLEIDQKH